MTSTLVVAHGHLASELLASAQMIIGPTQTAAAVDFPPGMGTDELASLVAEAIDELRAGSSDPVLILVDLAGGSPSRIAAAESLAGRAVAVTGANLPQLIEVLSAGAADAASAAQLAIQAGTAGIQEYGTAAARPVSGGLQ